MIVQFNWDEETQESKVLYFGLNNSFQLNSDVILSPGYKLAGIYGIFKKGKCYYVGQSQNVASRLTTHITGAYSECDEIRVYGIKEGFWDFYERSKDDQIGILENNECWYINTMKPIENIMVNRDKKPKKGLRIEQFESKKNLVEYGPCFTIYFGRDGVFTVLDGPPETSLAWIDQRCMDAYLEYEEDINHYLKTKAN